MSDLHTTLPNFDTKSYSHLLYSLEKNDVTTADLLTLDPVEIARRCPLPLLEVRRLVTDLIQTCQADAGITSVLSDSISDTLSAAKPSSKRRKWYEALKSTHIVATLAPEIDVALAGGIHTGYVAEIAGESAAGKTQFALGLLLSAQLPAPHGLGPGRGSIYISTEAPLNTARLSQILKTHPFYAALPADQRPSLDRVYTIPVNDLEAQDHILQFQLPVAIKRYNVGLVVIDSVAANYRAEHSTSNAEGMADRAGELAKLGGLLRRIARESDVAIITTNQVADRWDDSSGRVTQTQNLLHRSSSPANSSPIGPNRRESSKQLDSVMTLDHQSRFFTGWGNTNDMIPHSIHSNLLRAHASPARGENLKTPTLGLAWTNQIAARIVLKLVADTRLITTNESASQYAELGLDGNLYRDRRKRRFLHVVFCPWAPATGVDWDGETAAENVVGGDGGGEPVEYEIQAQGVTVVKDETRELLDERLWGFDGTGDGGEEDEYPF